MTIRQVFRNSVLVIYYVISDVIALFLCHSLLLLPMIAYEKQKFELSFFHTSSFFFHTSSKQRAGDVFSSDLSSSFHRWDGRLNHQLTRPRYILTKYL